MRKDAIDDHEAEHGEQEHAEGNEALLALLECKGTDTQKFDDAVEELATALNHHIGEEEQTILNPARTDVDDATRRAARRAFADRAQPASWTAARARSTTSGAIVERDQRQGKLDDDEEE